MKLKNKVISIFCSLFIIYGIINYVVQRTVILPKFIRLEQEETKRNLERVRESILSNLKHLDLLNHDWAAWNDTYNFVEDKNENYREGNLIYDSFNTNSLNLLYLYNIKGEKIWGKSYNLETKEEINLQEIPDKKIPNNHPLINFDFINNKLSDVFVRGILNTQKGPLLISSRPILTSENKGPPKGYIMMGRLLDNKMIDKLIKQTKVDFNIVLSDHSNFDQLYQKLSNLDQNDPFLEIKEHERKINAYIAFKTIDQIPSFIIQVIYPRDIVLSGMSSLNYALASVLLAGLVLLIIMLCLMKKTIVAPITTLTQRILAIQKQNEPSQETNTNSNDEIKFLSESFDTMITTIEEKTNQLELIASIDPLTELLNRRTFDAFFDKEWKRMSREKGYLSAILMDVDYFKKFNDYYGHQHGDKCLKKVARAIFSQVKRSGDIVARYGGEEFIAILPNTKYQGALHVAEKIREEVYNLKIQHKESEIDEWVTCSLGCCTIIPSHETSRFFLVKSADEALYMAKQAGRNRVAGIYE